jgi:hypothetical protein
LASQPPAGAGAPLAAGTGVATLNAASRLGRGGERRRVDLGGDAVAFSASVEATRRTRRPQWGMSATRVAGVDRRRRDVLSGVLGALVARRVG